MVSHCCNRDDSNNFRLFVDGKHLKTATNYTTNFSDADYFLGNLYSTGGASRTLKGFLDEVRITLKMFDIPPQTLHR